MSVINTAGEMMKLTDLERGVMEMLLNGDDPDRKILAEQFHAATVTKREMTGVGFYTTFLVPPEAPRLDGSKSLHLGNVAAEIEGLEHGAGFILFVTDGVIDVLEGVTFDGPWPVTTERFRLFYWTNDKSDIDDLGNSIAT